MSEPLDGPCFTAVAQGVVFDRDGTGFTDYGVAKERNPKLGDCTDWLFHFEGHSGRIGLEDGPENGWFLAVYDTDRPQVGDVPYHTRVCTASPTVGEVATVVREVVLARFEAALTVKVGTADQFVEVEG